MQLNSCTCTSVIHVQTHARHELIVCKIMYVCMYMCVCARGLLCACSIRSVNILHSTFSIMNEHERIYIILCLQNDHVTVQSKCEHLACNVQVWMPHDIIANESRMCACHGTCASARASGVYCMQAQCVCVYVCVCMCERITVCMQHTKRKHSA